ncbi:hypothetical protein C0J52_05080 [Blattella germanica]|nr:hypothetical protein C0J52_05080 [Blattella germanica]
MILSDPRRAVAVKKRRQISRYAEIVQRLLQERKKMERLKRGPKLVTKKTKSLVLKVEPTTTLPVEAMDHLETILEDECEMETEEEIKAEDLAAEEKEVTKIQKEKKGKKGAKKDKGKKAKEKKTTKKEKKKGEANKAKKKDKKGGKRKEGKVGKKGKKGKKSEGKGKKGKKKEEEGVVYVPPLEPLRRKIVLPEDILEPFQVEMQVPPPSPLPPDPYIEDFVCGRRYTKILHIRNIGPRSLKCRLHVVDQSGEGLITVLEADTANTRPILTGLSFTLRVSFEPVQDIQSEIAIIVLRTRRTGSPERELGIRVRCDPCQPEPIINPTEISIPAGSRWGSVLIENKGSKSCIFSIQNLPLVEYDDLLEEILDNVFREFQFMKKYNIEIGPQKSARIRVKFCPHGDPGPREEKFLFRFQECPPQEVTLRGTVTPNPLIVTPQWLELGLCLTDTHVLQKSFNITNISRSPVKVAVQASRVTVIPSHAFIYAGDTLRVSVRLVTKRLGNVKLPVVVHAGEHSVEVIVHCKSCKRQALTLIPKQINLGNVTVAETVTYPFRVKNKTAAVVGYGFLNLPPEVSIQPGDSFGTILPFGEISLQLLYSPTFQENASRTSSNKSSQNLESTSESSQAEMSYTLNTMESISSIENSPDISQTSQIPQVSSKVFHQSTESQSMLKVTSPEFPSTSTTEVSLTDQEILAKVPSIPGTSHRSFRLYCYADTGSKAEAYCTAQVVRLQCYMIPSSIYFPPTPCGSYNVIRTKLHALEDIRYEIKSSHESLHVAPRSGHLNTGAIVTIFLVFRPLQEDIPEHLLITCTTEFSWFQVPVFCKVVTPDYILIDDSPRIEFGPVVIGTRITTELLLLNMRSYSIKMLSTLLNPLGPFWSPVQYTNVESGHLLALPISFRPENLDTVFVSVQLILYF